MNRIRIIVFLFLGGLQAQIQTLDQIQEKVINQFDQINDYRVDIKISVKMTGFRMPRKKIRLYYKKPGKIKIDADGFAILPKTGVGGNPKEYFEMFETVMNISEVEFDGLSYYKITGIVNQDSLKIPVSIDKSDSLKIKMDVLIDPNQWTINQVDVSLNTKNIFIFKTIYTEIDGIYVPEKSEFRLGIKGISKWRTKNPHSFGGPSDGTLDFESIAKKAGYDSEKDEFAGTISMNFYKYKLNKGLKDKIFE